MTGLDIPDAAFGAGWQPYRLFSTMTMLLLLACLIAGGLLVMGVAAAGTAFMLPSLPPYWLLVLLLACFGYGCLAAQTAWTNAFVSAPPGAVVGSTSPSASRTPAWPPTSSRPPKRSSTPCCWPASAGTSPSRPPSRRRRR